LKLIVAHLILHISNNLHQDDGSHSVACEKCNVWQHSSCLGISKEDAEKDDFHFVCHDCKRKQEEANKPKIPPLKFRVSASASPSSVPPSGTKRAAEDTIAPPSPVKQSHAALASIQSRPPAVQAHAQPPTQHPLPSLTARGQFYVPPSPERRQYPTNQPSFHSSSPSRPPFSPSKGMDAPERSFINPSHGVAQNGVSLPPMQPGPQLPAFGSFHSARPSSSHSGNGAIQNRPSMSPTQGNHDVGPLAGFPHSQPSANGSGSWPSFQSQNYTTPRPQSGHGATLPMSSNYPSYSAAATPNGNPNPNHSSPPHSSHGMGLSGISPTKQSPRPLTSGSMAGAPVLPPLHRLDPSPKLMGRSSPDAPIPPPVKCMTPEQEERRQRENASIRHQGYHYPSNGQTHPMSSPSINRIPPLGPAATSQLPDPVPSPQHGYGGQHTQQ